MAWLLNAREELRLVLKPQQQGGRRASEAQASESIWADSQRAPKAREGGA